MHVRMCGCEEARESEGRVEGRIEGQVADEGCWGAKESERYVIWDLRIRRLSSPVFVFGYSPTPNIQRHGREVHQRNVPLISLAFKRRMQERFAARF
jgi:hypothetical protein